MSGFQWALVGASLFLALYAVRLLFGGRADEDGRRKKLGCGFTLVAVTVWSFAFSDALDSYGSGLRLALGLALVLSSLQVVFRPQTGRIAVAVTSLALGLWLAGPVVTGSWHRLRPSASESSLDELQTRIDELQRTLAGLDGYRETLRSDRRELEDELRRAGFADFDALAADPEAYARLREMAEIDEMLAAADQRQAAIEQRLPELESALRRLRRRVEAEATLGGELSEDEIRALLDESATLPLGPAGAPPRPTTLEEHLERKALQELFEQDVR